MIKNILSAVLLYLLTAMTASAQTSPLPSMFSVQKATEVYSCPSGFELQGKTCFKTNVTKATPVYSCPEGQKLEGTNCIKTVVTTNAAKPVYSCPEGFILDGTQCKKVMLNTDSQKQKSDSNK